MQNFLDIKIIFWFLALIFSGYSYYIYYKSIFDGHSKPHVFSWFLWWFISIVVWLIQFTHEWWLWVMNTLMVWVLCLWIAFLAYKKWDKDMSLSDKIFLWMWLISVALWIFVDIPLYSILILIAIDIFGFLPTFRKLYQKPYNEQVLAYLLASCWYSFSIFSLEEITFVTAWYVTCTAVFNLSLFFMVMVRRKWYIAEWLTIEKID